MTPGWYIRRLCSMDAAEILWRARSAAVQLRWRSRRGDRWPVPPPAALRWAGGSIPPGAGASGGATAVGALASAAEAILRGSWPVFAARADLAGEDPDWFRDPATGRSAPSDAYCFGVPYRDEDRVGNVKHLWEVSRLHHVTVLAAAWHQTEEARFAERALAHLRSWWRANPPLCGIHWISGIELGLRLLAWVWARRLLDGFPGAADAFERDPLFHRQLHAHQAWIAALHSRGSSANNHLVAEMAGLLAASLAFPLFGEESAAWAGLAAATLEREAGRQTFPDGLNREMAAGYHVFALELFLVAGCEADAAGAPLGDAYWQAVCAMADALAATVDAGLGTARQGDADDGRALLLDAPGRPAAGAVLEACARVLGPAPWWPPLPRPGEGSVGAALLVGLARRRGHPAPARPAARPNAFPAAGITILRDPAPGPGEIWCRLDHGPHGYLATAAHAHADALSIELRIGGRPVLVDPGTYCYHGERAWRDYFRSTVAHNTLELFGRDQARHAGPFLWVTHPKARLIAAGGLDGGERAEAEACHDGYRAAGAIHHRRVVLDRRARALEILDRVEGEAAAPIPARLAFHLHPEVACDLRGHVAALSWPADGSGSRGTATLTLPPGLRWSAHRGEVDPILGWYSARFGEKEPATLLLGCGAVLPGQVLRSRIAFAPGAGASGTVRAPALARNLGR